MSPLFASTAAGLFPWGVSWPSHFLHTTPASGGRCPSSSPPSPAPYTGLRHRILCSDLRYQPPSLQLTDSDSFSFKTKLEDDVDNAEMIAKDALELEEARRIQKEEVLREHNLWENPSQTNKYLTDLADAIKNVDALKDAQYKVEEAKLIIELADANFVDDQLFKQAYSASLDVSKILEQYKMSKLFHVPYDREGACMIITARSEDHDSEVWAEKLLNMYLRWAEKYGYKGRIADIHVAKKGGISSATVDFEGEYCYGYLSGEGGAHLLTKSSNDHSVDHEACAGVEVIPIFLESEPSISIDDGDLDISSVAELGRDPFSYQSSMAVKARHLPTGASIQYSGERNHFANKLKAINRLKAKLLAVKWRQAISDITEIDRDEMECAPWKETRRYVLQPKKLVLDAWTGLQVLDLNSVLDGNIEPFLRAHVDLRKERDEG